MSIDYELVVVRTKLLEKLSFREKTQFRCEGYGLKIVRKGCYSYVIPEPEGESGTIEARAIVIAPMLPPLAKIQIIGGRVNAESVE